MTSPSYAPTFALFTRKADALRVANRMRDHGIITGVRGQRGASEVFGYVPNNFTLAQMEALAAELFNESR